ncbi:MAG: outer membrane protein assembly factor BamD [candidate division Zixibacteria bacterium]|nr:outer membrane protein assembly factor BamD [candidate division Zixibacteria bacterium]
MTSKFVVLFALIIFALGIMYGCGKQSEQELFEMAEHAQEEGKPMDAIKAYRKLTELYPESEHAPKAQFMIGFVYAEQFADTAKALEAYEEFAAEFPEHELAASADFMIKSLRGEVPEPVLTE